MVRTTTAAALFAFLICSPATFGAQQQAAQQAAQDEAGERARDAESARTSSSAQRPRPNGKLLEVSRDRVADLFRERNGIAPKVGTAGPGSGIAAGAEVVERPLFETPLFVSGSVLYSIRGYEVYSAQIGSSRAGDRMTMPVADTRVSSIFDYAKRPQPGHAIYADLRYRHFPQIDFFGSGGSLRTATQADFLVRGGSYDLVAEYQVSERLGFAARAGVLDLSVGPGTDEDVPNLQEVFDPRVAPGMLNQPGFYHASAGMAFDTRERPGNPDSGSLVGVAIGRFEDRGRMGLSFTRMVVDTRTFLPARAVPGTIALRMLASSDRPDRGARVPFYMQQTLGGGDTLRGFDTFRFRDDNLLHFSAEYRLPLQRWLQAAIFYDAGQVFSGRHPLAFRNFESSWGAGARFTSKNSVKFRLDWATSREGHRFVIAAGPVF